MKITTITGTNLFEDEKEYIKDTVVHAVKSGADLSDANLSGADLTGADLTGADLRCADLSGADLRDTYLCGADLRGAKLRDAYLTGADLTGADLSGAKLYGADLSDTDLIGANLTGADLRGAKLSGAINIPHIPLACPSEGAFTAWKKVNGKLIELVIPADARRSSATTEKCRCDKARVVSITDIFTNEQLFEVINVNHTKTVYKVGEMVYPDAFDEDRFNECSNGIHFFINKQSAIDY